MILGLGNDIVDIRRIERVLQRFGDRFLTRVFTETEIRKALTRTDARHVRASTLAKRFAAKEACTKALGKEGVSWQDMEVVNLDSGKPVLRLSGGAKAALERLTPGGMKGHVDVTMADDYPQAQAIVIISATEQTQS